MKTPFIRTMLCLLCLAAVFTSFAACGKEETGDGASTNQTTQQPPAQTDEKLSDGLPDVDMDGFELSILSYTDAAHGYSLKTMTVEQDSEDMIESAIYRRNLSVENRFNCFITEEQVDRPYDVMRQSALIGSSDFDVALMYEEHIDRVLVANPTGLAFFEDIPHLNLSAPYWNQDANDVYSINGHQYAGVGDWCLSMYSKVYCYFLNKEVMNTVSLEESP